MDTQPDPRIAKWTFLWMARRSLLIAWMARGCLENLWMARRTLLIAWMARQSLQRLWMELHSTFKTYVYLYIKCGRQKIDEIVYFEIIVES